MNEKRRCGVIERLNEVCGAAICGSFGASTCSVRRGPSGHGSRPSPIASATARAAAPCRAGRARCGSRSAPPCRAAARAPRAPRANISPSPGIALGPPALARRRSRRALARAVEQGRGHLDPRHAVDRAVVHLHVQRDPAVLETLDHPELPERPAAVERRRVQVRDQLGELLVRAGGRHRNVSHVEVEVEVRVLDPVRVVEPERHLDDAAAERRQEVQPLGHGARAACGTASPRAASPWS